MPDATLEVVETVTQLDVVESDIWLEVSDSLPVLIETPIAQGPPGPPGKDGPGSEDAPIISADPDNRLTQGSDNGLYVSNTLNPDPLAYYILAKG